MESNQNISRLNIRFGENSEANPKINIKVNANFNQAQAKAQIDKLQILTQTSDLHNAIVILFNSSPGEKIKLIDQLKSLFEGQIKSQLSRGLSQAVKFKVLDYIVSETDNGVKLIMKPGTKSVDRIKEQIEVFLAMGLSDIVENQTNSLTLLLTSNQSFSEITKDIAEKTYTPALSLLRSFKTQLILNLNQNIITTAFKLLKEFGIDLKKSPIGFLELFKDLEVDLKFASTEELPEFLRSTLLTHGDFEYGLAIPPNEPKELIIFFKKLAEYVDNGINVYFFVNNIGFVHLELNGIGFSDHFTSKVKDMD